MTIITIKLNNKARVYDNLNKITWRIDDSLMDHLEKNLWFVFSKTLSIRRMYIKSI